MSADATIDGQDREETGRTLYESLRMPTTRVWWTSLPEDIREEWRTLAEKGLLGVPPMTSQRQATSEGAMSLNQTVTITGATYDRLQDAANQRDELRAAVERQAAEIQRMAGVLRYAEDCLQKYGDYDMCDCETCEECGKEPRDCSGTPCAQDCQCNECRHCHAEMCLEAIKASLDAEVPEASTDEAKA